MSDQQPVTLEEVWRLFKETDAKFKETDAKFKETGRLVSANAKHLGRLSKKWGDLGEAMTIGETLPLFNAIAGIEVHSLHPNVRLDYEGKEWEIDGIAIGKDTVVVIEAKATLKKEHVKTFISKTLKHFTRLEPDHIGKKIYGAVGFLSAHSSATELALASGLLLRLAPYNARFLARCLRSDLLLLRSGLSPSLFACPPPGVKLRNFHP